MKGKRHVLPKPSESYCECFLCGKGFFVTLTTTQRREHYVNKDGYKTYAIACLDCVGTDVDWRADTAIGRPAA